MPRIMATLGVFVMVIAAIGWNIVRYPAVWEMTAAPADRGPREADDSPATTLDEDAPANHAANGKSASHDPGRTTASAPPGAGGFGTNPPGPSQRETSQRDTDPGGTGGRYHRRSSAEDRPLTAAIRSSVPGSFGSEAAESWTASPDGLASGSPSGGFLPRAAAASAPPGPARLAESRQQPGERRMVPVELAADVGRRDVGRRDRDRGEYATARATRPDTASPGFDSAADAFGDAFGSPADDTSLDDSRGPSVDASLGAPADSPADSPVNTFADATGHRSAQAFASNQGRQGFAPAQGGAEVAELWPTPDAAASEAGEPSGDASGSEEVLRLPPIDNRWPATVSEDGPGDSLEGRAYPTTDM